ncbi:hypothetical protein P8452_49532 [Trifolium repens]|nr:hypothetical protein P8452_49532 [Trifolium repens]
MTQHSIRHAVRSKDTNTSQNLDLCCSIYGDEACVVHRVVVLVSDACVVALFWVGFEIEGEGVFFIRMNNE